MPKEDRSDWVAVAPEFSSTTGKNKNNNTNNSSTTVIRKPKTAFQFFQHTVGPTIRANLAAQGIPFDLADFGRRVRDQWQQLNEQDQREYQRLAQDDASRYARESHQADVAAWQRREALWKERNQMILSDEDNDNNNNNDGNNNNYGQKTRKTRGQRARQKNQEEEDDDSDDDDASSAEDDDHNAEGTASKKKKNKKKKPTPPVVSQKQMEYRQKVAREKSEKEQYIAQRQGELRHEKSAQAKRRLEFLLKQSNIFSHFGRVKQDTAKYGIKTVGTTVAVNANTSSDTTTNDDADRNDHDNNNNEKEEEEENQTASAISVKTKSRRLQDDFVDDDDEKQQALEEADTHEATFLTSQPTTLGFGKMREYQLEGLNWMIRLQENGVNGILADEMVRCGPKMYSPLPESWLRFANSGLTQFFAVVVLTPGIVRQKCWHAFDDGCNASIVN